MELKYYVLQISEVVWTFVMVVVMISEKKRNSLLKNKCQNVATFEEIVLVIHRFDH